MWILACERTTTLSFVRWISVSIAWVPALTAPLNAPIVFSGCFALYPRCAIVWGNRLPFLDFFACVHEARDFKSACEDAVGKSGIRFGYEVSIGISGASASESCMLLSKTNGGRAITRCRSGFWTVAMRSNGICK